MAGSLVKGKQFHSARRTWHRHLVCGRMPERSHAVRGARRETEAKAWKHHYVCRNSKDPGCQNRARTPWHPGTLPRFILETVGCYPGMAFGAFVGPDPRRRPAAG